MLKKDEIRKNYLNFRKSYDSFYIESESKKIVEKISIDPNFKKSKIVGIYFPILGEIDITKITSLFPGKVFAIPKIINQEMIFTKYNLGDELVKSSFNTLEVNNNSEVVPDIVFCPLLAVNYLNYRIGYGKGYYDRYFKTHNIKTKVGIAYTGSFTDFENDEFDVRLDYVISPSSYKKTVIVLAAGSGNRCGDIYKCLEYSSDKMVFEYSLFKFNKDYKKIVILPLEKFLDVDKKKDVIYLCGDSKRYLSMLKAKNYLEGNYIYIHDGARPYLEEGAIRLLENKEKENYDAFYLCKKAINTIRDEDDNIISDLTVCETPQVIKKELFKELKIENYDINYKDDIMLFKSVFPNLKIGKVYHESNNYKITYKSDLIEFKNLNSKKVFIGHSFDIHKISKKRPLYLGGIFIKDSFGLLAHSDGDCVIHAITEAIFGALSKRDLGYHFPPSDAKYKNISSLEFLKYGKKILKDSNYSIINVDILLYYDVHKLNNYFPKMLEFLKKYLETDLISLKATTAEKLGKIGKKKAIGCECHILVGEK